MNLDRDELLPSQLAALGRILRKSGLSATDFEWRDSDHDFAGYVPVPALVHKPTDSFFAIATDFEASGFDSIRKSGRRVCLSPGKEEGEEVHRRVDWRDVEARFQEWLTYLRRELAAPDFWEAVVSIDEMPVAGKRAEEPFTPAEQRVIEQRFDAMDRHLDEIKELTEDQTEYVRAEFIELRQQLSRMKRGQWSKFFLGTIANLALRHIPISVLREILDFVKGVLHVLTQGPLLPPLL